MADITEWENRQKKISQLIEELKTFEDQDLIVVVTDDGGKTFQTVKLVGKDFDGKTAYCVLHI